MQEPYQPSLPGFFPKAGSNSLVVDLPLSIVIGGEHDFRKSLSIPEPPPEDSEYPDVADLVCADIMDRKAFGVAKYGKPLRPFDGRATKRDLYQEMLDMVKYMRKLIYEEEGE